MKKLFLFFLLVAQGAIGAFGQTGQPCAEYKQDRTLSEMREILMRDGIYYDRLRASYAEAINYNIGRTVVSSSKEGINILLDNTVFVDSTFVKADNFLNGVKYGDNIRFTNLVGQYSKNWAALHYLGSDFVYAKVACLNSQKAKEKGVYVFEQKNITRPRLGREINFVSTKTEDFHASSIIRTVPINEVNQSQFKVIIVKTWFGRNYWWVVPVGAAVLTSGGIYIAKSINNHHSSIIEDRTMPPGQPTGPPGIPSDPRNQPNGVGSMKTNNFINTQGFGVSFRIGR